MTRLRAALRRHRERGIALVLVLWVLILAGLVAASFLRETRLGTNLARNITENAKAEALAEAGIQRAMLGLLDSDPVTAWRADGTPYQLSLGEGTVVVTIEDEGGKVDLNRAPAPVLIGLLEGVGIGADRARALADAIYDFRDADHDRRPAGAEDPDYLAAGRDGGAKDAPFDDKEELMQVLGMTREIHDAIRPYVTVHSRRSRINVLTAPEFVLRAMSGMTPEQLGKILAARAEGTPLNRARPEAVTVRAQAATRSGGAFIREAVLRYSGDAEHPFDIVEWRQAWRALPDTGESATADQ